MSNKPKPAKVKMWAVKYQSGSLSPYLEEYKGDAEHRVRIHNGRTSGNGNAAKVIRVLVQEIEK